MKRTRCLAYKQIMIYVVFEKISAEKPLDSSKKTVLSIMTFQLYDILVTKDIV